MSELMKQFLSAWLVWAESGEGEYKFDSGFGLCTNSRYWCERNGHPRRLLEDELIAMWDEEGLDEAYPFSNGYGIVYNKETNEETTHLNPRRLAWVRDTLK
jgi:hypothetical protein